MGGGLHTSVNRDTQRNAFKCSAQLRNNQWIDIFKKPLDSSKKYKKGRFKLLKDDNFNFTTVPIDTPGENQLRTVFKNGELLIDDSFEDIKKRTETYNKFPIKP